MTRSVVIVDYGSGNLRSAARAFSRVIGEENLPFSVSVSADPCAVREAERIVLPGQGAFGDCIAGLSAIPGMREALEEKVVRGGAPFLGICVGMQLMADTGFEHGTHKGLGWISGIVRRMTPADPALKIPHMGWNAIAPAEGGEAFSHPVLRDVRPGDHVYFVHSYVFDVAAKSDLFAVAEYAGTIPAAVGHGNMIGVQFHPEKSQKTGLSIISGFLGWNP